MTAPGTAAQLRRLVAAFFGRFFENELTAGADDLKSAFFALLAVLAVPGLFVPLLLAGVSAPLPSASGFGTDPAGWGWSMIARFQGTDALRAISRADKTFYLGFAMIASGMVSLIAWSTLGIDKRAHLVLGPLPVRETTVVVAKLAALSAYVSIVAVAMHALASIAFGTALASNNTAAFALRGIAAHFIASFAASVFVMLSVVAVQGLTLAAMGPRAFAHVSPVLQMCLVALVVGGIVALPAISGSVVSTLQQTGGGRSWILATPPLWFLGLYERVLGTSDATLIALARRATMAVLLATVTGLGSYLLAHGRLLAAAIEAHAGGGRVRGSAVVIRLLSGAAGREPAIRAVAYFFLTAVTRNHRQRLVLASALGAAAAWGLPAWVSLVDPPAVPQPGLLSWALTAPLFLLMGLRIASWHPVDLRAAWAFQLSTMSWRGGRAAMERTMFAIGLLPIVTVFALAYWWLWGPRVAVLHAAFSIAIGALLIQILLWRFEGVPCTRPWNPDVLKLRVSWPIYLAALTMLTPALPEFERLLLSQPAACLCFAAYVLAIAWSVRGAALTRAADDPVDPVGVLTSALRAARLDADPGQSATEPTKVPSPAQDLFGIHRRGASWPALPEWRGAVAEVRRLPDHLFRDVRVAGRRLIGAPIFTFFSILTLGCGVGVTTAVYSIVHAVLWVPPPVPDIDRVLELSARWNGRSGSAFSWPDFVELRDRQTSFAGLAASTMFQAPLLGEGVGEWVRGEAVNGSYFSTFGLRPALGRLIQPADDRADATPVAVLSYSLWRLRCASDPNVIGRTIKIDSRVFEVIGVAPAGFRGWDFGNLSQVPAIWVPIATGPDEIRARLANPKMRWVVVKGRLARERTIAQASAELMGIGRGLEAASPTPGAALTADAGSGRRWSAGPINDPDRHRIGLIGRMFVAAVALVLLIGCTNLANLTLARGSSREHDLAVRRALGASRADLVREQLVESGFIAVASALIAALIIRAATTLRLEIPAGPGQFVLLEPHLDAAVLLFAAAAGLCALATSAVWPALQLTHTPEREGLSTEGGTTPPHWRVHRRLIGWQVAASAALFLMAAACINVVLANARHDSGVDVDRLAVASIDFEINRLDRARTRAAIDAVLGAAAQHPDIDAVAASGSLPFGVGGSSGWSAARTDWPVGEPEHAVRFVPATPGIFPTLGVSILHGRGFAARDADGAQPVVVLNEAFAIRLWGRSDVAGRELLLARAAARSGERPPAAERVVVVGVAADTDVSRPGSREQGMVYAPLAQRDQTRVFFTARSAGDPRAAVAALRSAIRQADAGLAVEWSATGVVALAGQYLVLGYVAALVTTLGSLALLLAMTGLFGVVSHAVTRRTRELGVRLALGAERHRIVRLVMLDGLRPVADGLVLGLFAGAVCRAIIAATMSPSVAAVDPIAFLVVPALFVATALCACYWPARRASRVDPNVALRLL